MHYAVIQTDNVAITPEQLGRAMQVTRRYTRADGIKIARESYGLIVDKLDHDEANDLCGALASEGVHARVIEESELLELPPVKVPKRIDCLDEHLVIYDVLGRPRQLAWDQVLVVAAGQVNIYETQTFERTAWEKPKSPGTLVMGMGSVLPSMGALPVPVTTKLTRELEVTRLILELIVTGEPARYRAEAEDLIYTYLGERRRDPRTNFIQLTNDLIFRANSAVFNQGSVALSMNPDEAFTYDNRRSFEREIIWLVWWGTHQPGA